MKGLFVETLAYLAVPLKLFSTMISIVTSSVMQQAGSKTVLLAAHGITSLKQGAIIIKAKQVPAATTGTVTEFTSSVGDGVALNRPLGPAVATHTP